MQRLENAAKRAVGLKQTLKAVEKSQAKTVYVAKDAEEKIRRPLLELCRDKSIEVIETETMAELGKAGGIQVGAAAAAVLE